MLYLPPLPASPCSFEPLKGLTASVWPTWSSSTSEKHVTSRPATSGVPSVLLHWMSPMGPWQTAPTTFPAA